MFTTPILKYFVAFLKFEFLLCLQQKIQKLLLWGQRKPKGEIQSKTCVIFSWKYIVWLQFQGTVIFMQVFCTCIIILYSFLFFDYGGPIVNHTLPAWKRIAFVSYRSAFPNGLTIKSIIDYMKILSCITLVLLEIFPFKWQILQEVKKIIDIK